MLWTSDILPVILAAGRGSRMTELLGINAIPKCLLPFGGNPLIFYTMKNLALKGFANKKVLIIIQDRDDMRRTIMKVADQAGLHDVETFSVPEDSEDFGTAESIRLAMLANKITMDVLIISCDLIGDFPLGKLLTLHGLKESSFTSLYMTSLPFPADGKLPGVKMKPVIEKDILGIQESSEELVYMTAEADLDEELLLPSETLRKFPNFKLFTWLTDSHIYVIKKTILDKLLDKGDSDEKHLSLKGEFLPWIVQQRCSPQFQDSPVTCCALVEKEGQCLRVNSIQSYILACKSLEWVKSKYKDCIQKAKDTKIAKSAKLSGVNLGDYCFVGEKCKLLNVITLDHVNIGENVQLSNVIISSNVQIGEGAIVKDCLIGPKYQIQPEGRHTNEHLTVVDETFFEP